MAFLHHSKLLPNAISGSGSPPRALPSYLSPRSNREPASPDPMTVASGRIPQSPASPMSPLQRRPTDLDGVMRDRSEEEKFFKNARPPFIPEETIRKVQIRLDNDGDIVFFFENASLRYALCVVLNNPSRLGWKECQAIRDVMRIASRGTQIDNTSFEEFVERLRSKYGKVQDPFRQNGRFAAVVFPGQGTIRTEKPDTIVHTSISFDRADDLIFSATTNRDRVYRVCLELTLRNKCLFNLDCKAFVDILLMLETGDCLSPQQFLACGAILRKKYNYVTPSSSSHGRTLRMTVLASRVPNDAPVPTVFVDALNQVALESAHDTPDTSGLRCPYPDIQYTHMIKEGGQGQVFAGVRGNGSEHVAVKVFFEQEGATEAYKTELRMLLKMSHHPNVVEVLDFFEAPEPALVMRRIEGEDLMDYLRAHGAQDEQEGRRLAIGIAEGLCHLHRYGVIHRDFKSANILRQPDGTPVIIDLGLGSLLNRRGRRRNTTLSINELCSSFAATHLQQRTSTIRGSFPWMSPEMITDQEWSDKTDVYAFGIIMWEIFSGHTPFVRSGEDVNPVSLLFRIANGERPSLGDVSHISSDLRALIQACWDAEPRKRPSMRRVLDLLHGNDPRRIFRSLDHNGSGGLDFGEFVMFLQRYAPNRVEMDLMPNLFRAIDEDQSGEIGVEEFEKFWREVEASGLRNVVNNAKRKKIG